MPTLKDQRAQLAKAENNLKEIARLNAEVEEKKSHLCAPSRGRVRPSRETRMADGRWRRTTSPEDPPPTISPLKNSPPVSRNSDESSVDPWEANEEKRPAAVPPKSRNKYHDEDTVEAVRSLSDREDDPSDDGPGAVGRRKITIEERGRRGMLSDSERTRFREKYGWSPPRPEREKGFGDDSSQHVSSEESEDEQ